MRKLCIFRSTMRPLTSNACHTGLNSLADYLGGSNGCLIANVILRFKALSDSLCAGRFVHRFALGICNAVCSRVLFSSHITSSHCLFVLVYLLLLVSSNVVSNILNGLLFDQKTKIGKQNHLQQLNSTVLVSPTGFIFLVSLNLHRISNLKRK